MHGIQAWVALPEAAEETSPSFVHFDASQLPSHGEGAERQGHCGFGVWIEESGDDAFAVVLCPPRIDAGRTTEVCGGYSERAIYIAKGSVRIEGSQYETGQMAVLSPGAMPSVTAIEPSIVMLLGGEAVGPRNIWWNFVSPARSGSSRPKADWKAGRIQLPVDDDKEFIPLPEDPPPPRPEPMS